MSSIGDAAPEISSVELIQQIVTNINAQISSVHDELNVAQRTTDQAQVDAKS